MVQKILLPVTIEDCLPDKHFLCHRLFFSFFTGVNKKTVSTRGFQKVLVRKALHF